MQPSHHLIALGANLPSPAGEPRATLEAALARLEAEGLRVASRSRWFRTPAFPAGSGPHFVNGAAALEAGLTPGEVLAALHRVEAAFGRDRRLRWGPRSCDLDLIASGAVVLPDRDVQAAWMALPPGDRATAAPDALILPHPRMQERAFVLVPLAEIAPGWRHPVLRRTVRELARLLPEAARASVTRIEAGDEAG